LQGSGAFSQFPPVRSQNRSTCRDCRQKTVACRLPPAPFARLATVRGFPYHVPLDSRSETMAIRWGYCVKAADSARFKAAGWDYCEENIQGLLQGTLPEADWKGEATVKASPLPIPAANSI